MTVIQDPYDLQKKLIELKAQGKTIGFVPTMGALHQGHLSLITQSQRECDITVLSIFVNPTQFNNSNDFDKYPRTIESDLEILKNNPVDYIFYPDQKSLYADNYNYSVQERDKNTVLCGTTRPGHFQGVLTVIIKLLNITQAHKMYLGEKDYQQLEIIRGMAQSFFLTTEVKGCPTVRDTEGLALSSRNQRLSPKGIEKARRFAKLLKEPKNLQETSRALLQEGIQIDYLEEIWGRRFAAVFIEDVRLIDNVAL